MFKNYFKIAWRNVIRSKGYSALNILGLALGMAVALLIGLWVQYQYSFDKFLPDYKQLYRVQRNFNSNGDTLTFATTSLKLADVLRKEIPEIEYVAETDWMSSHGLMVGNKKFYVRGGLTGTDFLKMFQYTLLQGNKNTVFNDPYSIVLSESTAQALFGNEDAIGKMVRFDNSNDLKVTGILKHLPANSTFQFNFLVPFTYVEQTRKEAREKEGGFGGNAYQLFVQLKPGVSYAQVAPKLRNIEHTEKDNVNAMNSFVILQPLQNWHLYGNYVNGKESGGFIEYVRMFSIIGALVLLIACINFINLTTARSEKRAREVGVRKAIGSQRKDLILQFLTESFLLTSIAFLFAILLAQLALPAFNTLVLTRSKISIPFSNGLFWLLMIGCVLFTAIIAGARPAFYLSSFNPVKVLKGTIQGGSGATFSRKILVVVQFSCSVALIISTIIVYRQIQYAKERPKGYELTRLLKTDMNEELSRNYTALKNELIEKGIAESVTTASSPATNVLWHTDIDNWPGKNAGETVEMGAILINADYFRTLGIGFREGRAFETSSDTTNVIFNETAIKRLRIKDPVGKSITYSGYQLRIIGVAKDALMISPFSPADPTMFFYKNLPQGNLLYRLSPAIKTTEAIAQLNLLFNKYNPAYPYDFQFADASYEEKFNLEVLIGKLAAIFAGFAILISSIGLFGLAAYVAEQRTKEIGIRKVLGASISQVWILLSKDFIVLVIISCVIASPIALYFLKDWLQKYNYRINIGPGVFIIAAVIAILITLFTISFQAIKAATSNPVKSLRTE